MQLLHLHGKVGRQAEVRQTSNGQAIGFSVAVNENYKDKQGVKQEKTSWYEVTIWRPLGASTNFAASLVPGQSVVVTGQPYAEAYIKDGQAVAKQCVRVATRKHDVALSGYPKGHGAESDEIRLNDDDNDLPF